MHNVYTHTLVMILKGARSGSPGGVRVTFTCRISSLWVGTGFLSTLGMGEGSGGRSFLFTDGLRWSFVPLATEGDISAGTFLGE